MAADPKDLSSNWKRLQKTLELEKKTLPAVANTLKRKGADESPRADSKKQKVDTRRIANPKRRKMETGSNSEPLKKRSFSAPSASRPNGLQHGRGQQHATTDSLTRLPLAESARENEGVSPTNLPGKYIALDCEMVGVGPPPHLDSQLARVSITNFHGHQVYDSYVLPKLPVTDYRTHISGITAAHLKRGRPFSEVQGDVRILLEGRILVGHALKNDLDVLVLRHPKKDIRDTSRHPPFRVHSNGKAPPLKRLAKEYLGIDIQQGEHSSVVDAQTCMSLFRKEKDAFDAEYLKRWGKPPAPPNKVEDEEDEEKEKKIKGKTKKKKKRTKR